MLVLRCHLEGDIETGHALYNEFIDEAGNFGPTQIEDIDTESENLLRT